VAPVFQPTLFSLFQMWLGCLLTCLPFFCLLYDGLDAKNTVCCGKMPNDNGNIADHCQAKKYLKKICFIQPTYPTFFRI
jgi:hypothetical protein